MHRTPKNRTLVGAKKMTGRTRGPCTDTSQKDRQKTCVRAHTHTHACTSRHRHEHPYTHAARHTSMRRNTEKSISVQNEGGFFRVSSGQFKRVVADKLLYVFLCSTFFDQRKSNRVTLKLIYTTRVLFTVLFCLPFAYQEGKHTLQQRCEGQPWCRGHGTLPRNKRDHCADRPGGALATLRPRPPKSSVQRDMGGAIQAVANQNKTPAGWFFCPVWCFGIEAPSPPPLK